jgi:hypothetical protein
MKFPLEEVEMTFEEFRRTQLRDALGQVVVTMAKSIDAKTPDEAMMIIWQAIAELDRTARMIALQFDEETQPLS